MCNAVEKKHEFSTLTVARVEREVIQKEDSKHEWSMWRGGTVEDMTLLVPFYNK